MFTFTEREHIGDFQLSVQNSPSHYADAGTYELAIFEKGGKIWIIPPQDACFKHMEWAALFEDPGTSKWNRTSVAGWVPSATVDQIRKDLAAWSHP